MGKMKQKKNLITTGRYETEFPLQYNLRRKLSQYF